MKAATTYQLTTRDARHTYALGRLIGQLLEHGVTIQLLGDLGAGKTCFVQGLAAGLEVPETFAVTSPTYTLINEFPGRLPLFHVDLYRIHSSEDAEAIGFYDIMTLENVVAVEWADRLTDGDYPAERLCLHLNTGKDESRSIKIIGSGLKMHALIQKIGALWETLREGEFPAKQ